MEGGSSSYLAADDARLRWMKDVVSSALGTTPAQWDSFFPKYKDTIAKFFNKGIADAALLMYVDTSSEAPLAGSMKELEESKEPLPEAAAVDGDANAGSVSSNQANASYELVLAEKHLPDRAGHNKSIYFIKNSDEPVSTSPDAETMHSIMSSALDYGVLPGHTLIMLERLLKDIYIPMADPDASALAETMSRPDHMSQVSASVHSKAAETKAVEEGTDSVRNDFSVAAQKFTSQISHAIQQVTGNVHLPVPNVYIDPNNLQAAAQDEGLATQLEMALEEWINLIAKVIDQENKKKASGEGPMSEVNFWRDRNATLSALYEQLSMDYVKTMIQVMELAHVNLMALFKKHMADLLKLYTEAKDNVKFLSTLERHFKNISSGNLSIIQETIPSMLNSLRMVWIISRHYNKDARMFPLMMLIAKEIADKVAKEINIRTIFRRHPAEAKATIRKAYQVLDLWGQSYNQMREKIEASGSDHRWEFPRNKLFEHTVYMSNICVNLERWPRPWTSSASSSGPT